MYSSMEIPPSIRELPELDLMEDPNLFNDQWDNMNSVDGLGVFLVQEPASFGDTLQHYEASTSSHAAIDRPQKQLKITNGCNSCKTHISADIQSSFSPNILPFSSSNHSPFCHRISGTKDHTMAERKRREKLNQMFIAVSALVPGIKKMDRATVLGDAVKYIKQLQEKVKTPEEQARQKPMEYMACVKKHQLLIDSNGDFSSWDEHFSAPFDEPLPEIEARCCDQSVLISIHCEKKKGFLEKIISGI